MQDASFYDHHAAIGVHVNIAVFSCRDWPIMGRFPLCSEEASHDSLTSIK